MTQFRLDTIPFAGPFATFAQAADTASAADRACIADITADLDAPVAPRRSFGLTVGAVMAVIAATLTTHLIAVG